MRILLITLLLLTNIACASSIRLVTETNYMKEVNGNSGLEFVVRTTIGLATGIDLKLGFSENYTGHRAKPFMFNHGGTRADVGVYWDIFNDFKVGYTHSERKWFDGASPVDIFENDSVDTLSVRKEFNLKF